MKDTKCDSYFCYHSTLTLTLTPLLSYYQPFKYMQ